jgi:hypothetical protein
MAIFIDGLNDFYYAHGNPQLTDVLYRFMAPEMPSPTVAPINTEKDRVAAVSKIVGRYKNNIKMITSLAKTYDVTALFIGQPVPFLDFPKTSKTYPFPGSFAGHELCAWGYVRFREAARAGVFGEDFIWCGDAFSQAESIMYADSIHYSGQGAELLAQMIVRKAVENGIVLRGNGNQ